MSKSLACFSNPTTRNVMTGILLAPGPVCNLIIIQRSSQVFMSAVNKAKFVTAGNRLQGLGLGLMITVRAQHVFVKKSLVEMESLLLMEGCGDLCTMEEYRYRFCLPSPSIITPSVKKLLVEQNLVAVETFNGTSSN